MKKNLQDILNSLHEILPDVYNKYSVISFEIFGSYIRHEQNEKSDLDLLVSFSETPSLLRFIKLKNFLSDELKVEVDLVMKDGLKSELESSILNEAVQV